MSDRIVNASPLVFLAKLDRLEVLRPEEGSVLVPSEVLAEIHKKQDPASRVIEPRYDGLMDFSEGLAAFNQGGSFGLSGNVFGFHGGLWGFVDRTGRVAIEPRFVKAGDFHDGIAEVRTGGGQPLQVRLDGTLVPYPSPPEPGEDEN